MEVCDILNNMEGFLRYLRCSSLRKSKLKEFSIAFLYINILTLFQKKTSFNISIFHISNLIMPPKLQNQPKPSSKPNPKRKI